MNCPSCRSPLLPANVSNGRPETYFCRSCWQTIDAPSESPEMGLRDTETGQTGKGGEPGVKEPDLNGPTPEKALVLAIQDELTRRGYVVLKAGQKRSRGSGTTVGFPDLVIGRRHSGGRGVLLEVKVPGQGVLSPQQRIFAEEGVIVDVWSVGDAVRAVREAGL